MSATLTPREIENQTTDRWGSWTIAIALSAVAFMFSMGAVAIAAVKVGGSSGPSTASSAPAATAVATLSDYEIVLSKNTFESGPIEFTVRNTAATVHNISLEGVAKINNLKKGETATLTIPALEPGKYTLTCTVPGHKDLGMTTEFTVTKSTGAKPVAGATQPTPAAGSNTAESTTDATDWKAVDVAHREVVQSFLSGPPAKTAGLGNQPLKPTIENGVPVYDLTTKIVQWEVSPGTVYEAWTYNGTMPGPEIRIRQGQTIRVRLKNELPESTSIHWHGLEMSDNTQDGVTFVTQDPVLPGQTYVYTLTPINCGSHMYHSHHAADAQVPLGLLGALIVDCTTTPMPSFAAHDSEHTQILSDGPLGFTINGKGFPATSPIVAKVGEKTLIRFMNEGLIIHPMHLHGHRFLIVAKDGNYLPLPYEADTLNVAPGERYDVIVTSLYTGAWAFHCHILTHAESDKGLHGMTTVWAVKP